MLAGREHTYIRGSEDQMDATQKELNCLDDVPSAARQAVRQRFLAKWYQAVALAPLLSFCSSF